MEPFEAAARCTRSSAKEDNTLARIVHLVEEAEAQKSRS